MKRILTLLIICLFLSTSFSVITQANHINYSYENLKFICSDSNGFNEEKYQRYLQMFEQQMDSSKDIEVETIIYNNSFKSPLLIDNLNVDGGLMDSAWPMQSHDNRHTGLSPYSSSHNNGVELWKFEANSMINAGIVIDNDGCLYFGDSSGLVFSLFPDGSLKWCFDTGIGGCVLSSPALGVDGTVYVGSWDHYIYALNANGTLKWKFLTSFSSSLTSSPAIADDGTIILGDMAGSGSRVYAVNPDGTEKWHYNVDSWITSDPAIADDGTVYIGSSDTYLYAIKPNGKLKWKFKTDEMIKGPPSIDEDETVYIASFDGYLYAIHPDGTLKWKKAGLGGETTPIIGPDGMIYFVDDKLYAVYPEDGSIKWTFELSSREYPHNRHVHMSCPAISSDGIIYFGTNIGEVTGGEIIAVSTDGVEQWRHLISDNWVDSSPCIGSDGTVYIGGTRGFDTGYLYAFGEGQLDNNPPEMPSINGPQTGKCGKSYAYTISTEDPENHFIQYYVDWGDGSDSGWQGPFSSGIDIELSHSWSEQGYYTIKAKAKDEYGYESDWANLEVSMPKNKGFQQNLFLEKIILRFPILKEIFMNK